MINTKALSSYFLIIAGILFQNCTNQTTQEGHQMKMNGDALVEDTDLFDVSVSANRFVISNQRTVKPIYSEGQSAIPAEGYITEDIRRNQKVSTRIAGRIERLYIRYNYQYVKKGEKIMDIYSPDLNTYLEEYLFLKKTGDSVLLYTAKQKLLLLGIRESQLFRLQKQDSVGLTIDILSPSEGYIIFESSSPIVQNPSSPPSSEMGSMAAGAKKSPSYPASGRIREGAYVNAGETLFRVNDFKEVWAVLSFRAQDQSLIKSGIQVALHSELLLQDTLRGTINFIEPLYEEGQKFLQARVYLKNLRLELKPNSILTAEVFSANARKMRLPQSSVFHLGKHDVVWVKNKMTKGQSALFEARVISKGAEQDGFVEIISGIDDNDEVALDAGYLMDSQSIVILK